MTASTPSDLLARLRDLARRRDLLGAIVGASAAFFALRWYDAKSLSYGPALAVAWSHVDRAQVPFDRLFAGGVLAAVLVSLMSGRLGDRLGARLGRAEWPRDLVSAAFGAAMLWAVRDVVHAMGDGPSLLRDPVRVIVRGGYYTFVEELAGMWLPLRLAQLRFASGAEKNPVEAILWGYQLVSIAGGAVYVAAVARASRRVREPWLFSMLFVLDAIVLQFAGYVENYGTAVLLLTLGFLVAALALREGRLGLREVTFANACFTLAVAFHGVAVWSVFSLVLLAIVAARRSLARFAVVVATNLAVSAVILGGVYALFAKVLTPGVAAVHLKPTAFLRTWAAMMQHRPPKDHLIAIARVATPAIVLFTAALLARPRRVLFALVRPDALFALAYLAGFVVHQIVWISTIGIVRDWDLFGFTWLPLAYLAYDALEAAEPSTRARVGAFVVALLTGFGWVLSFSALGPPAR